MVGTHLPFSLIYTLSQYPLLALDIPRDCRNYAWRYSSALKVPSTITGQALWRWEVPGVLETCVYNQ